MYTVIAQNKYGQQLELTHNDAYVITGIEGLDPPESVINTTRNASADGSVFNSSYIDNRQIIITMAINYPAEINRIGLYKYFKTKDIVRLFYKNQSRDVYIDGYVKNIDITYFDKKQIVQITIICPDPLFKAKTKTLIDFTSVIPLFEFPFSVEETKEIEFSEALLDQEKDIINGGDVETGMIITFHARESVVNPMIYNTETNQYFGLDLTMDAGDEITVNTIKKQKQVTLLSDGVTSNIIGKVKSGSTWLQLLTGDNLYTVSAESGAENLDTYCTVTDLFEGV